MNDAIPICLGVALLKRPMSVPLLRHHMLDGKFPSGYPLVAKARLSVSPASQMILDGLEHHAQPTATKTTIGQQCAKLLLKLGIIWPVPTHARLASQVIFDHVAGGRSV